ncbi:YopX family protein [Cytobacillus sp. FSL R7-0680]|uniref:YopX family protein n=1 Tax=Cytobacillus sp. FSL R7-0680 TaxID=2921689 RepID=UPI0030F7757D
MREIKFRAWDKSRKEMEYINNMYWFEENGVDDINNNVFLDFMQYTGLKDKNGKEIYEGDEVELNDFDSLRTGGHTEDNILQGEVSFSCGAWIVITERGHYDLYNALVNDEEFEIIGNIYENPELINQEK